MKIAVLGASGRSGKAFVIAALKAGHEISAGVRTYNPFEPSPSLRIVVCDGTNRDQVRALLEGQEAVVSLIGHVKGSPERIQTEIIDTLISVMEEVGIRRLVSLTGTGVRFPGDHIRLMDRFANMSIGMIDPSRISDGKTHVDRIQHSSLDWTIVRVLKLTNAAARPYRLSVDGPTKLFVGRAEVSRAILEVLEQHSFIQQAPIISAVRSRS